MRYPSDCYTPADKTEFLYRAQEMLQRLHNKFVEWRDVGFTREQYEELPSTITKKYPYKIRINDIEWRRFHDEDFLPKSNDIVDGILIQRAAHKQSNRWNVDIGDVTGDPQLSVFTRLLNWVFG